MKVCAVIFAYLYVSAFAIYQVLALENEGQNVSPQRGMCAVETNVNRALHNYMMAACNRMMPGSMRNMNMVETLNIPTELVHSIMMMPDVMRGASQNLNARDVKDEANPAQIFAPFPPFPPFPPYPFSRPAPVAPVVPVAPVEPVAPVTPAPPRVLPPITQSPPVTPALPTEVPTIWIQPIWTSPPAWAPPVVGTPVFPPFPPFPPYPPQY